MDHERRFERDDKRSDPPSEGVRIIGAEEAAEALERGDVAQRRGDDQPRYGDRPAPPASDGPRPCCASRWARRPTPPTSAARRCPSRSPSPSSCRTGRSRPPARCRRSCPTRRRATATTSRTGPASPHRRRAGATMLVAVPGEGGFDDVEAWGDEEGGRMGALDDRERPTHDDFFSFADLDDGGPPDTLGLRRRGRRHRRRRRRPSARSGRTSPASSRSPTRTRRPRRAAWPPASASDGRRGHATAPRDRGTGRRRRPRPRPGGHRRRRASSRSPWSCSRSARRRPMLLVTAVIGLAAAELFTALRQAGYHPVTLAGITGSVGLVLGAYNWHYEAIPTVLFLTTVVCLLFYLFGAGHGDAGDEHRRHAARRAVGRACSARSPR